MKKLNFRDYLAGSARADVSDGWYLIAMLHVGYFARKSNGSDWVWKETHNTFEYALAACEEHHEKETA